MSTQAPTTAPAADPAGHDTLPVRRVAVTGASGLIGAALVRQLEREGVQVRRLVRSRDKARGGDVYWNPDAGEIDAEGLAGIDAAVHLAGESVAARWTDERRRRILRSRVDGTTLLARTLAGLQPKPAVLVSASAVGIYGSRGDEELTEDSAPGSDFLAEVGREWEAAAKPAAEAGIRVVNTRFGIVLSADGGALGQMLPPFRLGVGGRLGSGRQWMSWISLEDTVGAIRFCMEHEEVSGPVNVVGPAPVRNDEFAATLGTVLGRPAVLPVPAFALRLLFGEMADGAILASQRAFPRKLTDHGYRFRHPTLSGALGAAVRGG
ncbi:MAG TPA: TIGR01777 family oxidoreductase [Longimicrobiaceae bacterium]|nr:TIGR01777 family oxidoreductase [Longimicrobiaceae bacterium]